MYFLKNKIIYIKKIFHLFTFLKFFKYQSNKGISQKLRQIVSMH